MHASISCPAAFLDVQVSTLCSLGSAVTASRLHCLLRYEPH